MSWRITRTGLLVFGLAALTACSRPIPAPVEFRSAAPETPTPASVRPSIPAGSVPAAPAATTVRVRTAQQLPPIQPGTYVVQPGDSLFAVAQRSDVALRDLIDSNGLSPPYHLNAGQTLSIPAVRYHTVRPGETVTAIADAHGVSMRTLVAANGIAPPYVIRSGTRLRLPAAMEQDDTNTTMTVAAAPAPAPPIEVPWSTVRSGPARTTPDPATATPRTAQTAPLPSARPPGHGNTPPLPGQKPGTQLVSAEPAPAIIPRPPRRAGQRFAWPVDGQVISGFGPKSGGFFNDGINIAVRPGTPVRAAENGVVTYVGNELRGFGNLVLLRHEGGWVTAYAHAAEIDVRPGDIVRRGQVIAKAGRSGRVNRPQLHFEIRKGRKAVNPLSHLPKSASGAKVASMSQSLG